MAIVHVKLDFYVTVEGDGIPRVDPIDVMEKGVGSFAQEILPGGRMSLLIVAKNPRAARPAGERRAQVARRKTATRRR